MFPFEEDLEEFKECDISFINKVETDKKDEILLSFIDFNDDFEINVFQKKFRLDKDYISDENIKREFINKIDELSEKSFNNANSNKFIFNYGNDISPIDNRMIIARILNGSNLIATSGRIGPAHHIVISEENYKKFEINSLETFSNFNIIIYPVDDILLFRKNNTDQPGISYIINPSTNKYNIITVGNTPEKQCMKIKLNYEN